MGYGEIQRLEKQIAQLSLAIDEMKEELDDVRKTLKLREKKVTKKKAAPKKKRNVVTTAGNPSTKDD